MSLVAMTLLMSYVSKFDEYQGVRYRISEAGADVARQMRQTAGMSLRRYADHLKISASYLSKIENGREALPPEIARRMLIDGKSK